MAIRQELLLELSDIIGPENAPDMTECAFPFSVILSYILSFQDANDIKVTLKDIIGNESVANRIATEILKSRGQVSFLLIIYHLLVGCQGKTNNCVKVKTIQRK